MVNEVNTKHNYEDKEVVDVGGQKYLVGIDEHGYLTIEVGEIRLDPETDEDVFVSYNDQMSINLDGKAFEKIKKMGEKL